MASRLLRVLAAAALCGWCGEAGGGGTTASAPGAEGREVFGPLTLARGQKREVRFDAPATPAGREAVLVLQARIAFNVPAGYTLAMRLALNGKPLDGARLVNKRLSEERVNGATQGMASGDLLTVPYAPDFDATDRDPSYDFKRVRACEFVLRVTDLAKVGANALVIENAVGTGDLALFVGAGRLEFRAPAAATRKAGPPAGPLPVFAPATAHKVRYAVEPGEPLAITLAGETFRVESQFSTPEPKWVSGSNRYFKWTRAVEQRDEAVVVRDTFENLTDENLPLMQRHRVPMPLRKVWLAGLSPTGLTGGAADPANPTVFGVTEKVGLGLMPLDDVFQVHVSVAADGKSITLADPNLVLKPRATRTAEWAILPTAAPDYFAFVNAARRLRDVNFQIPGSFSFLRADQWLADQWTDAQMTDFARFRSARFLCCGADPHGTAVQTQDQGPRRKHLARMRRLAPKSKHLVYFHCFLETAAGADRKYADARVLDGAGTQCVYGGDPKMRIFCPTAENAFGCDIAGNVDTILDQVGADGVYWDEMEYSAVQYHYGEPWDGVSADIDSNTLRVARLKSSVTLLSQPWRLALARKIMARGPLIANGSPHTRSMAELHFPRFVETGSISYCVDAQLFTPIALGDALTERNEVDAYRDMLRALDYGCVYYWYDDVHTGIPTHPHLTHYMFPITPVELGPGYIIGRERIVTNRSGLFGWGDASQMEVHVFDDEGREAKDFRAPVVSRDGATFVELRLAEGWSAAIVRGGPATRRVYGAALLEEPGGFVLSNPDVRYELSEASGYALTGIEVEKGPVALPLEGMQFSWRENGKWRNDSGPEKATGFRVEKWEASGNPRLLRLTVVTQSDRLRLTRTFSFGAEGTSLGVRYRVESLAPQDIERGYGPMLWMKRLPENWVRLENVIRDGRVAREIATGPSAIGRRIGNQDWTLTVPFIGWYDARAGAGLLVEMDEGSPSRLTCGQQGQRAFIGVAFTGPLLDSFTASLLLTPFVGDPAAAARRGQSATRPASRPWKADTGRALANDNDVSLWWDLPTSKVLREEPAPVVRAPAVDLSAAADEYEPFQLVLRPKAALPPVRLECSGLRRGDHVIGAEHVTWNPLEYYRCEWFLSSDGVVGELPDTLLPPGPTECVPGRNQPFWVTVHVPRRTPPGEYLGTVRVLAGDRVLAEVPVRLTVWDFTLPVERNLAAFLNPWPDIAQKRYGARMKAVWPAFLDDLARHRAGPLHPGAEPVPRWDEKGEVATVDWTAFVAAVAENAKYHFDRVVLPDFTLGWDHVPQATRFGKAGEILTPLWRTRCRTYAAALSRYLREQGWNEKVVFSLFDEPGEKYYPMLADTVSFLKGVDHVWRFTYWGGYARPLEGVVQVWCWPMEDYQPALARRLRERGDEVWVYNPPGYRVDQTAMAVRANYWWLWQEHIPVVYQWTINAWTEWTGNQGFWDAHRQASWVVPGEKGILSTLRWELTREGLEDYEYLTLLRQLTDAASRAGRADLAAVGEAALDKVGDIASSRSGGEAAIVHTEDQGKLHALRLEVGRAIERIRQGF